MYLQTFQISLSSFLVHVLYFLLLNIYHIVKNINLIQNIISICTGYIEYLSNFTYALSTLLFFLSVFKKYIIGSANIEYSCIEYNDTSSKKLPFTCIDIYNTYIIFNIDITIICFTLCFIGI